jgi:hypothetical protein
MNFGTLFKAFDTLLVLRDTAKRLKGEPTAPPATDLAAPPPGQGGQIEARLTGVVVAALKEAFDRDHARLELERAQMEEQRRRAEEAMRLELRRQAADREVGRLRLLAGTALVGWIASVLMFVVRIEGASLLSRGIIAAGWLLLLAALGAAFRAQGRISAFIPEGDRPLEIGRSGEAAMWLLVAGLGVSATSLLF